VHTSHVRFFVVVVVVIVIFYLRKIYDRSKMTKKKLYNLFGSVPYSGRSLSIKSLCSKTELSRCTISQIRWNKNEDARTSPVVSTNRQLPNSLKNWRAFLLIRVRDSTEIGTNSPCDGSPAYYYYYYFYYYYTE